MDSTIVAAVINSVTGTHQQTKTPLY